MNCHFSTPFHLLPLMQFSPFVIKEDALQDPLSYQHLSPVSSFHKMCCGANFKRKLFSLWLTEFSILCYYKTTRHSYILKNYGNARPTHQKLFCIHSGAHSPSDAQFLFFFNRENFIIKNSVSFLSFRIFFLNQQTCFASRDKGNILGLKHQYTMDGSKSYLVLLTWYLFFMIQGLVSSFWNTEVFFLPLRMEKTFLSNTAVLREKQESWKHHKKIITEYKQNKNCDKLCIFFREETS